MAAPRLDLDRWMRWGRAWALAWCARAAGCGLALCVVACGFVPQRQPQLPAGPWWVETTQPRSDWWREAQTQLARSSATLAATPEQAAFRLQLLEHSHQRSTVATAAAGQVRTVGLVARLRYSVSDAQGRALLPPTLLQTARELSYSENQALAKAHEMQFLEEAMRQELLRQVLYRLAQIQRAPAPTAASRAASAVGDAMPLAVSSPASASL